MTEKINIAEILKDCPSGMELDCALYDNVVFDRISNGQIYPIKIKTPEHSILLTKNGCYSDNKFSRCIIFPKGKTTWEGFVPPCKFKDGDVVATTKGLWIGITAGGEKGKFIPTYCVIQYDGKFEAYLNRKESRVFNRLATEEEKEKLFQSIKDNGYKWNPETKTLEKFTPNKFDINTLKAFDKVLVRDNNEQFWTCDWFSFHDTKQVYPFACVGHYVSQCIPYEENQHLLGTTNDCREYFKTW